MATKSKNNKQETSVETMRIAVLGPSFVGKTQIVNRIVNNNFFAHYDATDGQEVYKIFHNRAHPATKPDFVMIELLDCFPQDHPLLFKDPVTNEEAKQMQEDLQKVIENKPEDDKPGSKKWIDAFIFVYNSADKNSFKKLLKIIKSVHDFEESYAKGREQDGSLHVMKYVLGSKKDLKPHKQVLEDTELEELSSYNSHDKINLQEVSALTAQGIHEVFDSILEEVVGAADLGANRDDANNQSEDDEDSEEEQPDEEEEEETKQEGGAGAPERRRKKQAEQQEQTDFMSAQIMKVTHGASRHGRDGGAGGGRRGPTQATPGQDEGGAAGFFKSFMPFLFEQEQETAGQTKKGRR